MSVKTLILLLILLPLGLFSQSKVSYDNVSQITEKEIDEIYSLVIDSILLELKITYSPLVSKEDLCFEKTFTDSIHYNEFSESSVHYKLLVLDTTTNEYKKNPVYTDRKYDPNKKHKFYYYNEYGYVAHKDKLDLPKENEDTCIAKITFGRLYKEKKFFHAQIFIDWNDVNVNTKRLQLYAIQLESRDYSNLRFGTIDESMLWH